MLLGCWNKGIHRVNSCYLFIYPSFLSSDLIQVWVVEDQIEGEGILFKGVYGQVVYSGESNQYFLADHRPYSIITVYTVPCW